ncbi:hypothetical protein HYPSUDRAFT_32385 [Hypholoma sublateritium FD-334 SS-4]|uniref:Uncharacterized protein n=1 Tax=Hypholoma sublateritium (strain FD-334 SS-4) TaxID=945553 RepID=A0A0D2N1K3_HYPSF|nr:hypothetical protein HYPSUDRAFT_32385 [Hypholoma sublateritium FD-334 SS-4]
MYPSFNLYPGVYPYLDIYPATYGFRNIYSTPSVPIEVDRQLYTPMAAAYPSFVLYQSVYPYFDLYPAPYFKDDTLEEMTTTSQNPESVVVQSSSRYPIFNLYPAVYPYFDIYPSLPSSPVAPTKRADVIATRFSSRLTHAELHAMVMMEKVGSTGSFGHMEHGINPSESDIQASPHANFLYDASHDANLRNFGTPARNINRSSSSQAYRVSMAFKAGAYSMSQDRSNQSESQRTTPEFNSSSISLSRTRSLRHEQPDFPLPPHSSVAQRRDTMSRSNSLRDQIHTGSSIGLPSRPAPPRKRDSIVLQRVKAYDSTAEAMVSTRDTLSKFPMPPKAPLPPLPIDRSGTL